MGEAKWRKVNDPTWARKRAGSSMSSNTPKELFKFMSAQYAEDLILGKSIKVGTLYDFRDSEKHGRLKADPSEGKVTLMGEPFAPTRLDTRSMTPALRSALGGVTFTDCEVSVPFGRAISLSTGDCNVLCLSTEFDPKIAESLDDSYDCCVRIGSPERFIHQVADGLGRRLGVEFQYYMGLVKYVPREIPLDSPEIFNSPFHKGENFAVQKEFRAAFLTQAPTDQFFSFDALGCDMSICWRRSAGPTDGIISP